MASNILKKTEAEKKERQYGTFDLETFGLGGPFADATVFTSEYHIRVRSLPELFDELLNPPRRVSKNRKVSKAKFIWYAHNGAKYDFCYLIQMINDYAKENNYPVSTTPQGQKLIGYTIETSTGKIEFRDSLPLVKGSLDKLATSFCHQFPKMDHCLEHDFSKDDATEDDWYNPDCHTCVKYMMRDSEALYYVIKEYSTILYDTFGVNPAMTEGSTAMRGWTNTIPDDKVYFPQAPEKENWLRQFAIGGYVNPGWTTEPQYDMVTVDRTAAYAATMKGDFPTSAGVWTGEYVDGLFGFYICDVDYPETLMPIVPAKNDAGGTIYPVGKFTGYASSEMMSYLSQFGVKFEVKEGLVFERMEPIFFDFINLCESLEYPNGQKAKGAIVEVTKGLRNSLSGKFNTKRITEKLYIGECPDEEYFPAVNPDTGDLLPYYLCPEEIDAPFIHPEWYALTTERQRMEEFRIAHRQDNIGKMDTDSCSMKWSHLKELMKDGTVVIAPGYGNYKIEHDWYVLYQFGPKNYAGWEYDENGTDEAPDGRKIRWVAHCKGIPTRELMKMKNHDLQLRAAKGEDASVEFEAVLSPQAMLKMGVSIPETKRKRSPGNPNKVAGWRLNGNLFQPIIINVTNITLQNSSI